MSAKRAAAGWEKSLRGVCRLSYRMSSQGRKLETGQKAFGPRFQVWSWLICSIKRVWRKGLY